jgi:hypothetical protein
LEETKRDSDGYRKAPSKDYSKYAKIKGMLNGIVQDSQIEEKIIEFDFDDDKINKWAATLAPKDAKKSKGEN